MSSDDPKSATGASKSTKRLFDEADRGINETLDAVLPFMQKNLQNVSGGTRDALLTEFGVPRDPPAKKETGSGSNGVGSIIIVCAFLSLFGLALVAYAAS